MYNDNKEIRPCPSLIVCEKVSQDQNFTGVNLLKVEQNSDAILILSVKFFDFILLRFLMIFLTTLLFEVVHHVF